MNGMQDRLKLIRTDKNMSQDEFGRIIGLSRSQIGCYEKGIREITERSMNDICREFNINKEWLITGEGEIYSVSREDERLAEALAEISLSENEKLKELVQKMIKLDDKYVDSILILIDGLIKNTQK